MSMLNLKAYKKNWWRAGIIYAVVFLCIIAYSYGSSVLYIGAEYPQDHWIYILSIFAAFLLSWVGYLVFYLWHRHKAKTEPNLEYLGSGMCIIAAVIVSVIAAAVLLVLCFFGPAWEDVETILRYNFDVPWGFVVVLVITNLVVFILLKPRP